MAISAEKLQQILSKYSQARIIDPAESLEKPVNNGYWGIKAPERLELASASLRKALMAQWLLDLSHEDRFQTGIFPVAVAEQLPVWFANHVENGDNTLAPDVEIFLGRYKGVPVHAVSTVGETPANNEPENQALRKVNGRYDLLTRQGRIARLASDQYLIVMAGDTVENVHPNKPGKKDFLIQGKPYNLPEYPKNQPGKLKAFWKEYYRTRMPTGSRVEHVTGVAAMKIGHGNNILKSGKATLEYTVPKQSELSRLVYDPDPNSGGGGGTQRIIARGSREYAEWTDYHKFQFICQIMGMPLNYFLLMAQRISLDGAQRVTL